MAISKIISESLDLTDDYAFTGTITGAGGTNTPAFLARNSAAQTVAGITITLMAFDTEVFDTDNTFTNTSSNYKFTPGIAGKYFIYSSIAYDGVDSGESVNMYLYKNGNYISSGGNHIDSVNFHGDSANNVCQSWLTAIVDANTTDYFQIYSRHTDTNNNDTRTDYGNIFMAYKIIE